MQHVSPESVNISSSNLAYIGPRMQKLVDERRVSGIVTLAARHGKIFHFDSWGFQDVAKQTPMEKDSIFRIYSMTKPIVSVALMMLFEQGKFQLTEPISRYLPKFEALTIMHPDGSTEPAEVPITFQHVLTHQAGFSYGFTEDSPVEELYRKAELFKPTVKLDEMIDKVAQLPLIYQPGTAWRYSVATDVVGRLIECLSDMSLEDYLQEKILRPLNMHNTGYWVPAEKMNRFTTLYGDSPKHGPMTTFDKPEISSHGNPNIVHRGGSGLVSTAEDYLRFAQLVLNKGTFDGVRLLGPRTIDYMTTNHIPTSHFPIGSDATMLGMGFGLGFSTIMDPAKNGVLGSVGNHGWSGMADTHFWVDTKEDLIGMTYTQYIGLQTMPIRYDFKNILYGAIEN